jgi:hypothetical protein
MPGKSARSQLLGIRASPAPQQNNPRKSRTSRKRDFLKLPENGLADAGASKNRKSTDGDAFSIVVRPSSNGRRSASMSHGDFPVRIFLYRLDRPYRKDRLKLLRFHV